MRDKTGTDRTYSDASLHLSRYSISEEAAVTRFRRALVVLLVIFVIYAVINDPTQSASVTGNAWDRIKDAISSIGTFFDTLINS